MLLTKLSAHPEHPGQGWLQMYPAQPQGPEASFNLGMAQTGHSCPAWKEKNVIFIEDNCIEQQ